MMQNEAILQKLAQVHLAFEQYMLTLSDAQLVFAEVGKWSAAQQVQHIYTSVRPLAIGLKLPKFLLRLIWGKANRASNTYEALVEKYTMKISSGGKAPAAFVPKKVAANEVVYWCGKMQKAVQQLVKNCKKFSELELDSIVLPHPLLGKLTLREMLYFTIYHVQHHQASVERELK